MNFKQSFQNEGEVSVIGGYGHANYAASFGGRRALRLAAAGGWLIRRPVGETGLFDATGPYPLFRCQRWGALEDELKQMESDRSLVSVSLVVDPLGKPKASLLSRIFNHVAYPFKTHYLVDLRGSKRLPVSANHRRNLNKALRVVEIESCPVPADHENEWVALYERLIERHRITGVAAFSRRSLAAQLRVPGMHMFRAKQRGQTVGMCLWIREGVYCWYHLAAYSDAGYRAGASFALFDHAIRHFRRSGVEVVNLGGGAGNIARDDGLTRFKAGWSTRTASAWFCGHIVDRVSYQRLSDEAGASSGLFPAYRF